MHRYRYCVPARLPAAGLLLAALLGTPASADIASVSSSPLSSFTIFSGGGASYNNQSNYETALGGHNTIYGNIGSNQDLRMIGGQDATGWAQVHGSVYVGGYLNLGQPLTIGSPTLRATVVVNGTNLTNPPGGALEADIGGTIYGDLFTTGDVRLGSTAAMRQVGGLGGNVQRTGSYTAAAGSLVQGTVSAVGSTTTFPTITMPAATVFTAGGANQTVPAGPGTLTLAPGAFGTLATSAQNQSVYLTSGTYRFDAISAQGSFTLNIDLSSGLPISIYSLGDIAFAQHNTLMVRGAGTGGLYVPISAAQSLASLIYFETRSQFSMGGATDVAPNTWGGTVYASLREDSSSSGSLGEVQLGQHTNWFGALYAFDSIDIADHNTFTYVGIPTPATLPLLALGGVMAHRRRR